MRRRILLLTVGLTTLVVLAFAIPLTFLIRSAVEQRALRTASDEATGVALFLRNGDPSATELSSYLTTLARRSDRRSCVELADGTIVGRQPPGGIPYDRPAQEFDPDGDRDGDRGAITSESLYGGRVVRLAVTANGGTSVVTTFVPGPVLRDGLGGWLGLVGGASAALLLLSALAAEVVSRRLVRPLTRTAATAHRLSTGDVLARAPAEGPREVADVARALNQLAGRIGDLLREERELVADLSHRLRTPLTALRLDVESLPPGPAADALGGHVNSLERTLTSIIAVARRPVREALVARCDAVAVTRDRVEFWSALAEDQGRHVDVALPPGPVPVAVDADDLAAALDALLENVVAHTPDGADFSVHVDIGAQTVAVRVADTGPGLAPIMAERGRSDRGSSGLGLSIARRCAEQSGGRLEIDRSPAGGALVTLVLARA